MIWVDMKMELYRIDIVGDNYFEKYFIHTWYTIILYDRILGSYKHMIIPYDHILGSPVYDYMVLTYISTYDHTI